MKIGIITLNGYFNYGNRLQNYALQTVLSQYADEVNTIWHTPNNFLPELWIWNWKTIIKYILNWNKTREYVCNEYTYDLVRETNIKNFTDRHISIKYDFKINEGLSNQYDYFVVGSDQVWNPYFACGEAEFLSFAPRQKRIAYAASFGVTEIPKENEQNFTSWLNGMNFISVREQAGAKLVKTLTGKEVPVLADPTLLLTQEDWCKIARKPTWYKPKKYMLTYFLGEPPQAALQTILQIAADNGLEIIHLMDKTHLAWYAVAPDEFLYLIQYSSLVYTDSFHGAIFSILMKTPFVVCSREKLGKQSMDSRLDTLLKLFDLGHRRATIDNNYSINKPMKLEFTNVDDTLLRERTKARAYLSAALKVKADI